MYSSSILLPLQIAHIKSQPSDWCVYEHLDREFSGSGEHAYFYVEKTGLNTQDVVTALAQAFSVEDGDIGYAGLKDKHAVTRQWFSVPTNEDRWPLQDERIQCLDSQRHSSKLRRGSHAYNIFEITLRECCSEVDPQVFGQPFANRFGPQRVSRSNVDQASSWLARTYGAQRRRGAKKANRRGGRQGWHMSVLRSLVFNTVLDLRVASGNAHIVVEGEVLEDGQPTGPLWGRGRSCAEAEAAQLEQQALVGLEEICRGLEFSGLSHERRRLMQQPSRFSGERLTNSEILLRFSLPPGVYATSLLGDKIDLVDVSKPT